MEGRVNFSFCHTKWTHSKWFRYDDVSKKEKQHNGPVEKTMKTIWNTENTMNHFEFYWIRVHFIRKNCFGNGITLNTESLSIYKISYFVSGAGHKNGIFEYIHAWNGNYFEHSNAAAR